MNKKYLREASEFIGEAYYLKGFQGQILGHGYALPVSRKFIFEWKEGNEVIVCENIKEFKNEFFINKGDLVRIQQHCCGGEDPFNGEPFERDYY